MEQSLLVAAKLLNLATDCLRHVVYKSNQVRTSQRPKMLAFALTQTEQTKQIQPATTAYEDAYKTKQMLWTQLDYSSWR